MNTNMGQLSFLGHPYVSKAELLVDWAYIKCLILKTKRKKEGRSILMSRLESIWNDF